MSKQVVCPVCESVAVELDHIKREYFDEEGNLFGKGISVPVEIYFCRDCHRFFD